jgi:hypothetical protein
LSGDLSDCFDRIDRGVDQISDRLDRINARMTHIEWMVDEIVWALERREASNSQFGFIANFRGSLSDLRCACCRGNGLRALALTTIDPPSLTGIDPLT